MLDLNKFKEEVHENAVAHGFWEGEKDEAEIFALIHSELSEALEEYRAGRGNMWFACNELFGNGEPCDPKDKYDCANYSFREKCEHRSKKPEGIAVELADCVIRILDYMGYREMDAEALRSIWIQWCEGASLPQLVAACHVHISNAYENSLDGLWDDAEDCLCECISYVREWCEANGINLEEIMLMKHEYNRGRPYLHNKRF